MISPFRRPLSGGWGFCMSLKSLTPRSSPKGEGSFCFCLIQNSFASLVLSESSNASYPLSPLGERAGERGFFTQLKYFNSCKIPALSGGWGFCFWEIFYFLNKCLTSLELGVYIEYIKIIK